MWQKHSRVSHDSNWDWIYATTLRKFKTQDTSLPKGSHKSTPEQKRTAVSEHSLYLALKKRWNQALQTCCVSEVLQQLPLGGFPLGSYISVFDAAPGLCETVYLYRTGVGRHQWRAVLMQSSMDNSGSRTVPASCLWKECHAAGITDRSCSHGGLLFWWDGSTVLTKVRKDVLVSSRSPGTYNTKCTGWFLCVWQCVLHYCAALEDIKISSVYLVIEYFTGVLCVLSGSDNDQSVSSKLWRLVRLSLTRLWCNVKESDY